MFRLYSFVMNKLNGTEHWRSDTDRGQPTLAEWYRQVTTNIGGVILTGETNIGGVILTGDNQHWRSDTDRWQPTLAEWYWQRTTNIGGVILTGDNQHWRSDTDREQPTRTDNNLASATLYTTHFSWTFLGSNSALSGERPATRRHKSDTAKNTLRSMNAGSLFESYRRFSGNLCSMFRKEEWIFSRWVEHVPQYSWPVSTTSHNVTSRIKGLHKNSEPRFEIRMSRMWFRISNSFDAASDGRLKWSTRKGRNQEEGETERVCRHSFLSGSCPCFRNSHSECQGFMLSPVDRMPLVEWLCRLPK
jgi:hypothetical protein